MILPLLESVFQGLIRSFNFKKREFKISSPISYSLYTLKTDIYIFNSVEFIPVYFIFYTIASRIALFHF